MSHGARLLRRAAVLLAMAEGPGAPGAHQLASEIEQHLLEPVSGTRRVSFRAPVETLTDHDRRRIEGWNQAAEQLHKLGWLR